MLNGGIYEELARRLVVQPFERDTGGNVDIVPGSAAEMIARLRAEQAAPTIDVAIVDRLVVGANLDDSLFEIIDRSNIPNLQSLAGGRDVTALPPHRRNVGMVFQRYALFPHLTAAENVAYGLENRGFARNAMAARVVESLDLVSLRGFDQRYPHQLSGGQQQRVAMARAIAYRPDVLLHDEPFSSLDARLRASLRTDLRQLQRTLGITTVFVTHDQQSRACRSPVPPPRAPRRSRSSADTRTHQ